MMWEKIALASLSGGVVPARGGGDSIAQSLAWGFNMQPRWSRAQTRDGQVDLPLTSHGILRKWSNLSKSQLPDLQNEEKSAYLSRVYRLHCDDSRKYSWHVLGAQ